MYSEENITLHHVYNEKIILTLFSVTVLKNRFSLKTDFGYLEQNVGYEYSKEGMT